LLKVRPERATAPVFGVVTYFQYWSMSIFYVRCAARSRKRGESVPRP